MTPKEPFQPTRSKKIGLEKNAFSTDRSRDLGSLLSEFNDCSDYLEYH